MAQQIIRIGDVPNDGLGEKARPAGIIINENFAELYAFADGETAARLAGDQAVSDQVPHAITAQVYPTRAELLTRDLPIFQTSVMTSGYASPGVGGARHQLRGTIPSHPGYFQTPNGSVWEISIRAGERLNPEMLGSYIGAADEYAYLNNTVLVAAALGVPIELAPRWYKMLSRIDTGDVQIYGVPGRSHLDFSGAPAFQNGSNDGWIRPMGSLGTAQVLSVNAKFDAPYQFRVTSATRTGTTVTANTDMPHGYAIGDPVWQWGGGDAGVPAGQAPFVTQRVAETGLTTPFIVTSVPTSTSYTYAVPNSGDTVLAGSPTIFCRRAADILIVPDTSAFSANGLALVTSNAVRTDGGSENIQIGELAYVNQVLSSTMLWLHASVTDTYNVSDAASVCPVNALRGVKISGVTIVGKGPNPATTGNWYGDRAISALYCDGIIVENCNFIDCDQMNVAVTSCINFTIQNNRVIFNGSNEAGRSTGALAIQYGIAYCGASRAGTICNNRIHGGRHAIDQSVAYGAPGVARNITITGNQLSGQWLEAIATHMEVDNLVITNNDIHGSRGGINVRYASGLVVTGNNINTLETGVWLYGRISSAVIEGNHIRARLWPVMVYSPTTAADFIGRLNIAANNIIGGETGIYVVAQNAGILAKNISVRGNIVDGCKYEGIRVSLGSTANSADGWYGSVIGNQVNDCGQAGGRYGIWLQNAKNVAVNDNHIRAVTTLASGIRIDGLGTLPSDIFTNRLTGPITTPLDVAANAGTGHRTDMVTTESLTISGGAITPKFATTRHISVDTEGGASSDDLDVINGSSPGLPLTLRCENSARTVNVRSAAPGGNLRLAGGVTMPLDNVFDQLSLINSFGTLVETARSSFN